MTTLTRPNATQVTYDPTVSGVVEDTVQEALDSLLSKYRFIREMGVLAQGSTILTTSNIITDYDTVHIYLNGVKQQPDTYMVTDDQEITLSEPTPFTYKYLIELSSGATFLALSPYEQGLVQDAIAAGGLADADADRAEAAALSAEEDAVRAENAANTATALGGAVYVTTDQTVGGVKTFSSSPLVPTVADTTDSSTKTASTAFVQAVAADFKANWTAARVYHVGQAPGMYATLADAITAINAAAVAPSTNNRVVINVWPGKYTMTAAVTVPAYVGIQGVSKGLVQFQNDTTDMFICSGNNWFEDFLIEGSATTTLYAFNCNNANAIHIRRVDMLNNGGIARQRFLTQVGTTWAILFIEDCIIDYRGTSGYSVLLQNSGAAARFVDTNINDVFFDAYGLTSFGGSFLLRGIQDVRIKRSTIRGAATHNTGIRLEKSGVTGTPSVEVKHCDMANVQNAAGGVSIYNESGTTVYLTNSDAPNSIFDGTVVNRNSNVA